MGNITEFAKAAGVDEKTALDMAGSNKPVSGPQGGGFDPSTRLYQMLVEIYKMSPADAAKKVEELETEQANRTSKDLRVKSDQLDVDADRSFARARQAVNGLSESSDRLNKFAHNHDNFRIPGLSDIADAAGAVVQPIPFANQIPRKPMPPIPPAFPVSQQGVMDATLAAKRSQDEKDAAARMLQEYLHAQDAQRAEAARRDQLWVQSWGNQNAPLVDQRGMIVPNSGNRGIK